LSGTTVDGISVHGDIEEHELDATHGLLSEATSFTDISAGCIEGASAQKARIFGLSLRLRLQECGAKLSPWSTTMIGIDFSSLGVGFGWAFLYMGFEYLGAVMAAVLFGWCRPDEHGGSPDYSLHTRLLSEFLGTFYLVLTVGLNVLGKSPAPVFSIGSALMCMIYALGSCSGAHFNPAVTLAIVCCGRNKCSISEGIAYMLMQIVAGISAAGVYSALHHGKTFPLEPGIGHTWIAAGMAEVVYTFVLCFVVLCVATVKEPSADMFGLAIGSCVTAGGYAIGAVSGGSLNPAVSFGIAASSVMAQGNFFNAFGWSMMEMIGASLAAIVFRMTHPSEYAKGLKCEP